MIDAATRRLGSGGPELALAGTRIGSGDDRKELVASLNELIEDYWDHRAVTGRRLCRHIARALKPLAPARSIDGGADSEPDPVSAILSNIAGRLATI